MHTPSGRAQATVPICSTPLGVPDSVRGLYDFAAACQAHDDCYDTLFSDRAACDNRFRKDMLSSCDQIHGQPRLTSKAWLKKKSCIARANTFFGFVRSFGWYFWNRAQIELVSIRVEYHFDAKQINVIAENVKTNTRISTVAVKWSVSQRDGTSAQGSSSTDRDGSATIPLKRSGPGGVTGNVTVEVAGVGAATQAICLRRRVAWPACRIASVSDAYKWPADFSGVWNGTYNGRLYATDKCGEFPISGNVTLKLAQKATNVTGTITLQGSHIQYDLSSCLVTGRSDETFDIGGTVSGDTGDSLTGSSFSMEISSNVLVGSFHGSGGEASFRASPG